MRLTAWKITTRPVHKHGECLIGSVPIISIVKHEMERHKVPMIVEPDGTGWAFTEGTDPGCCVNTPFIRTSPVERADMPYHIGERFDRTAKALHLRAVAVNGEPEGGAN